MNKISVCLIVKNEERCLARCLESVKACADEIVIIDTGSTDKTKEIALAYTDKVYDAAWQDDYSAARNEYFKYATGDMIFSIDADEWLAPNAADAVNKLKEQAAGLYMVLIASITSDRRVFKGTNYRIFPNDKACAYVGFVHENIRNPDSKYPRGRTPVMLLHDGYINEQRKAKGTESRNLRLLLKQLEATPSNPYYHYHIGMQYMTVEEYTKAAAHYSKALELIEAVPASEFINYIPACYDGLSAICYASKDAALYEKLKAVETIASAFYINLGAYCEYIGDDIQALQHYDKAIQHCKDGYKLISCDTSACTWRPYACKGHLFFKKGETQAAIDCFRLALLEEPNRLELMAILSRLYCKIDRLVPAQRLAEDIVKEEDTAGNNLHLADIYLNNYKQAEGIALYKKHASPEHILNVASLMEKEGKADIAKALNEHITQREYLHTAKVAPRAACVNVIIPTLAKANQDDFMATLRKLSACAAVNNIIIMDNTEERAYNNLKSIDKLVVFSGVNNYVNPAWNYGVDISDTDYFLLLNDDVLCSAGIVDECASILDADKDFDVLLAKTGADTLAEYDKNSSSNEISVYVNVPINFVEGGWFIFGRRKAWTPIPAGLKIFYGDNFIYDTAVFTHKRKIGKVLSNYIAHATSTTVKAQGIYKQGILEQEGALYEKIRRDTF